MEALKKFSVDLRNEWTAQRLHTLVSAYPGTVLLVSVSLTTFVTIQANYLIQLLAWVMYFLDIVARYMFSWLYPAALVAIIVVWCIHMFSVDTSRFDMPYYPGIVVMLRVVLCVVTGQLTLLCLPPVVNFFVMPFASAPTLLFTIVFSVGMIGYSLYLVLRQTLPRTLEREPRNNNYVGGDFDTGDNTCIVCLANPRTHLIKPCNHYCVCSDCIRQLNECPLCKRPINMNKRIYAT